MLASLAGALLQALAGFLRGWLGDLRASAGARDLGAANAANETLQTVAETADERAHIPPVPDEPAALAKRLRDAAAARGGGGSASG